MGWDHFRPMRQNAGPVMRGFAMLQIHCRWSPATCKSRMRNQSLDTCVFSLLLYWHILCMPHCYMLTTLHQSETDTYNFTQIIADIFSNIFHTLLNGQNDKQETFFPPPHHCEHAVIPNMECVTSPCVCTHEASISPFSASCLYVYRWPDIFYEEERTFWKRPQ